MQRFLTVFDRIRCLERCGCKLDHQWSSLPGNCNPNTGCWRHRRVPGNRRHTWRNLEFPDQSVTRNRWHHDCIALLDCRTFSRSTGSLSRSTKKDRQTDSGRKETGGKMKTKWRSLLLFFTQRIRGWYYDRVGWDCTEGMRLWQKMRQMITLWQRIRLCSLLRIRLGLYHCTKFSPSKSRMDLMHLNTSRHLTSSSRCFYAHAHALSPLTF